MINRLPKKVREKYKRKLGWDEELVLFVMKVVGSTILFFVMAISVDIYQLVH